MSVSVAPLATVKVPAPVSVPPLQTLLAPVSVKLSDPPSDPPDNVRVGRVTVWPVLKLTVLPLIANADSVSWLVEIVTVPPVKDTVALEAKVPDMVTVEPVANVTVPDPPNVTFCRVVVPPAKLNVVPFATVYVLLVPLPPPVKFRVPFCTLSVPPFTSCRARVFVPAPPTSRLAPFAIVSVPLPPNVPPVQELAAPSKEMASDPPTEPLDRVSVWMETNWPVLKLTVLPSIVTLGS